MSEDHDITPADALQVAQRALAKVNDLESELETLRADHEDAVEELTKLRLWTSEFETDRTYESLGKDAKIGMVREHAFERALDNGGRGKIDYKDVKWGVFNGEPGASHCYNLLRWAAGEDEAAQRDIRSGTVGFRYRNPDSGNIHLAVDADLAKRESSLFAQKKDAQESGVI